MSNDEPDEVERTEPAHRNELAAAADEKTLKRARWEHLRLAAVPGARRVNVCNVSYGVQEKAEHTYTVTIGPDGLPTDCGCPAAEYQSGPCKHAVAVAGDREVLDAAMHGGSEPSTDAGADEQVATDGGRPTTEDYVDLGEMYERTGDRPDACRCDEQLSADMVCTECLRRDFATPNPEVR